MILPEQYLARQLEFCFAILFSFLKYTNLEKANRLRCQQREDKKIWLP